MMMWDRMLRMPHQTVKRSPLGRGLGLRYYLRPSSSACNDRRRPSDALAAQRSADDRSASESPPTEAAVPVTCPGAAAAPHCGRGLCGSALDRAHPRPKGRASPTGAHETSGGTTLPPVTDI